MLVAADDDAGVSSVLVTGADEEASNELATVEAVSGVAWEEVGVEAG